MSAQSDECHSMTRLRSFPHAGLPKRRHQQIPQPAIRRIGLRVRMPIQISVVVRHLEREGQHAIAEQSIDDPRIALRHRQNQIGLAHHAARREVVLAAQPDPPLQSVPAQLVVLDTEAAAPGAHQDVLLRQVGLQIQLALDRRMARPRDDDQALGVDKLPSHLIG